MTKRFPWLNRPEALALWCLLLVLLLSPMPGLLVKLAVKEGDEVKEGEELAVVEAMKKENSLRAERDGIVARVSAAEGDSLVVDQPIVEFE